MHSVIIPSRYLAPKWQAYVTPKSQSFVFSNGVEVTSLWSLKQALLRLPEDVIQHHIRPDGNDIANWIRNIIGDVALADEIAKYNHRWGLIVGLERQLMRTLNLPHYLAVRWLRQVNEAFTFANGQQAASLQQLAEILETIDEEVVAFHRERKPNDISVWVSDVIGDYELGELLDEASSKTQMHRFISDHVEMLNEAAKDC